MEAEDSRESELIMVRSSATGRFLVVDHMLPFDFLECSVEASIGKVRLRLRPSPQRFLWGMLLTGCHAGGTGRLFKGLSIGTGKEWGVEVELPRRFLVSRLRRNWEEEGRASQIVQISHSTSGPCAHSMEAMPCAVASILASDAGASSCSLLNWHFTLRAERELSKGLFVK